MAKKEKPKKTLEEVLKMISKFLVKAMEFDEIYTKKLRNIFTEFPSILEDSKRIERARSDIYSKKFDEKKLEPFFNELALALSELTARCRETIGTNAYLNKRGDVADFLAQEGPWGEYMEQLDFLFESHPFIIPGSPDRPKSYESVVVALIASLKMFNSIASEIR